MIIYKQSRIQVRPSVKVPRPWDETKNIKIHVITCTN